MADKLRVFKMRFGAVYPLYVQKAEKKGRTKAEVDEVISWLTGYGPKALQRVIDSDTDFEAFFAKAPRLNPDAKLITGVVCGVRVEEVADPLMRKMRWLDKLVDELARGKAMASILRQPARAAAGAPKAGRTTAGAPKAGRTTAGAPKAGRTPVRGPKRQVRRSAR